MSQSAVDAQVGIDLQIVDFAVDQFVSVFFGEVSSVEIESCLRGQVEFDRTVGQNELRAEIQNVNTILHC